MTETFNEIRRTRKGAGTTYLAAIYEAQVEEMRRDPNVIIVGEDLTINLYGASAGFEAEFGPLRVRDTPMSENAYIGAGVGAAMTGLRPICDLTVASFVFVAMDQIVSQAAKNRYMFGGQRDIPLTIRASLMYGGTSGAHHADRPYSMLMNVPGLKIIAPSTPADVKGLLKTAIRENDPVISFEDSSLWLTRGAIPKDDDYLIPLGVADIKRDGSDVTIVAIAGAVRHALEAAEVLAEEGISAEVVDPRTLVPLDYETIIASVAKTGHLVVVDPAHRTCSAASEISATVAERAFPSLRAPILRVATPDMQVPASSVLVAELFPDAAKIAAAVRRVLKVA